MSETCLEDTSPKMFYIAFLVQTYAQCMGCESACFSDCSNKYKQEIMDPDVLPGGGGFAGTFMEVDKLAQLEAEYLDCMDGSRQCQAMKSDKDLVLKAPKKIQKKIEKMLKEKNVTGVLSMKQRFENNKCVSMLAQKAEKMQKNSKHLEHAKKFLRHTKSMKKEMAKSFLQEEQPFYFNVGLFTKGVMGLSECLDICIAAHCPCPGPDGNYLARYPASVDSGAAEAAGLATADDAEDAQELSENLLTSLENRRDGPPIQPIMSLEPASVDETMEDKPEGEPLMPLEFGKF